MPASAESPSELALPALDVRGLVRRAAAPAALAAAAALAVVVAGGPLRAFAAGLLAVALARDSVGIALFAAFCAWQMSDVWTAVHAEPRERERDPSQSTVGPK